MKQIAPLVLLAVALVAGRAAFAQDEDSAPAAPAAEETGQATVEAGAPDMAAESHPMRALRSGKKDGKTTSPFESSPGGGGGSAGGGGIRCEDSVPRLTGGVDKQDMKSFSFLQGRPVFFTLRPNSAVSYKFTAPKKGALMFGTEEATKDRQVSLLISVSEIPCDFDPVKAAVNKQGRCHALRRHLVRQLKRGPEA
jgi:hypothetical protein